MMFRTGRGAGAPASDFDERRPHEQGFSAIYRSHVLPQIVSMESMRRLAVQEAWLRGGLVAAGFGALVYFLPANWRWLAYILLMSALFFAMEGGFIQRFVMNRLEAYRRHRAGLLLRAVCNYTPDCTYRADAEGAQSWETLSSLGALHGVDRTFFSYVVPEFRADWIIEGRYRGLAYALMYGRHTGTRSYDPIRSLLLVIEAPGPIPGRTEIRFGGRLAGAIDSKVPPFSRLSQVAIPGLDPATTGAVYARSDTLLPAFVTTDLVGGLRTLSHLVDRSGVPFAFDQSRVWLFPVFLFDDKSTRPPEHRYEREVREYLRLVNLILRTIDCLRGDQLQAVD